MHATTIVKWAVGALLGFVVLVALGVAILHLTDWQLMRRMLVTQVRQATGRELEIKGGFNVALSLSPRITAEQVTFANAPWGSRQEMVRIRRVEAEVALLPFLNGQIYVTHLTLSEPDVLLEQSAQGQGNWVVGSPDEATPTGDLPVVTDLLVQNGILKYQEHGSPLAVQVALDRLSGHAKDASSPIVLEGSGVYQDQPFVFQTTFGAIEQLRQDDAPYPLHIEARIAETRASVDGEVQDPLSLAGVDVTLTLTGPNLAQLGSLIHYSLPPTAPYHLDGHLTSQEEGWVLNGLQATVGDSDIAGTLVMALPENARPRLEGKLTSSLLAWQDVQGVWSNGGEPTQETPARSSTSPRSLFPSEPIPLAPLRVIDADISLHADRIRGPNLTLSSVALEAHLNEGTLEVQPLQAELAGGQLAGHITSWLTRVSPR